jgi:hypothetical protein
MFGRENPYFRWDAGRTLRTLSWLHEDMLRAGVFTVAGLQRAAREASGHGILLAGLAELCLPLDLEAATELAREAAEAGPWLPEALGILAWTEHLGQRLDRRDEAVETLEEVFATGLGKEPGLVAVRRSVFEASSARPESARRLLLAALRADPELRSRIETDPNYGVLRELLP